jgi:hypothetical protein
MIQIFPSSGSSMLRIYSDVTIFILGALNLLFALEQPDIKQQNSAAIDKTIIIFFNFSAINNPTF